MLHDTKVCEDQGYWKDLLLYAEEIHQNMRKALILHPFLFAVFPVLFLFSRSMDEFRVKVILGPVVTTTCLALLLWSVLSSVLKDKEKAGFIVSLFLVPLFSYENLYDEIRDFMVGLGASRVGTRRSLLIVSAMLFALGAYFVLRTRRNLRNVTHIANLMSGFLVAVSLINITAYSLGAGPAWQENEAIEDTVIEPIYLDEPGLLPDIYYITLDGYGRADVLEEIYQYDNTEFLDYLMEKGFYVASESRSNYCQTLLSLASSLNLTYLDDLVSQVGIESRSRVTAIDMIMNSRVFRFLKDRGYVIVAYSSGWVGTEMRNADIYLAPRWSPDGFQTQLINMTPIPFLARQLGVYDEYGIHRERILYTLDQLADVPRLEAPTFVFAHIIAPHPPFVFGRHGEEITPDYRFALHDATHVISKRRLTQDEYVQGYRDQLMFINSRVKETIDGILAQSTRPPIIILQADHGPGAMLDWDDPDKSYLKERFSILNAYYLPYGRDTHLYESITPVNTFNLLFNQYFGADYGLLEDESYFSTWGCPYAFINVTDEVNSSVGVLHPQ
jgi:hypothetical protein